MLFIKVKTFATGQNPWCRLMLHWAVCLVKVHLLVCLLTSDSAGDSTYDSMH